MFSTRNTDEAERTSRVTVPDDLRPALTEALIDGLVDLEALVHVAGDDGEDARAWHRSERALLSGLLAGEHEIEFPAAGSGRLHGMIAERARQAITEGARDTAAAWVALWAQFPERSAL